MEQVWLLEGAERRRVGGTLVVLRKKRSELMLGTDYHRFP